MRHLLHSLATGVARGVAGAFSFSGRATLWDLIVLNFFLGLASALADLPFQSLGFEQRWAAETLVGLVFLAPAIAAYARRFHDIGLSGWWALMLLPLALWNVYRSYRVNFAALNPEWLDQPDPMAGLVWWLIPSGITLLVAFIAPGTRGANRYGPDPRERNQPKSDRVAASTSA